MDIEGTSEAVVARIVIEGKSAIEYTNNVETCFGMRRARLIPLHNLSLLYLLIRHSDTRRRSYREMPGSAGGLCTSQAHTFDLAGMQMQKVVQLTTHPTIK